jgi:hypothetical protein
MVLVKGKTVALVLLTIVLFWLYFNPAALVHFINLKRSDPWYGTIRFFYDVHHGPILALLPFIAAAVSFFLSWSWWSISFFELDDQYLTYAIRPILSNSIPRRAIQDIRAVKPYLGMIFGYGTLIVDAGRTEESLLFVPHLDDFLAALR